MSSQAAVPTIEAARGKLEAIELHKQAIVKQLLISASHPAHQIAQDHFIKQQLGLIADAAEDALDSFEDPEDLAQVCDNQNASGDGSERVNTNRIVSEFEATVARLKEYHHHHPQPDWTHSVETLTLVEAEKLIPFTESERMGKTLDLQDHYHNYVNFYEVSTQKMESSKTLQSDACRVLKYVDFVKQLSSVYRDPKIIGRPRKLSAIDAYAKNVSSLLSYLVSFQNNLKPLESESIEAALKDVELQFKSKWAQYGSRDWLQGVTKDDVPKVQTLALLEAKLERMMVVLGSTLNKTATFTTIKQTRSTEELLLDNERELNDFLDAFTMDSAAGAGAGASSSNVVGTGGGDGTMKASDYGANQKKNLDLYTEEETSKFGVRDVPLDVDGNPIPLWMQKLHQIKKKFTCQICGNEVYSGPKVFEEHFREERHLEGLQRLGIPDYHPCVYLAVEPQAAVDRFLKYTKEKSKMHMREGDEELEDTHGTVFTKSGLHEFHKNIGK